MKRNYLDKRAPVQVQKSDPSATSQHTVCTKNAIYIYLKFNNYHAMKQK